MMVGADRATVVGRQSASTNGNITGMVLPSDLLVVFTGMAVRYPDDATFHAVGLVPDLAVTPTPAGRDPELEAAVDFLTTPSTRP